MLAAFIPSACSQDLPQVWQLCRQFGRSSVAGQLGDEYEKQPIARENAAMGESGTHWCSDDPVMITAVDPRRLV